MQATDLLTSLSACGVSLGLNSDGGLTATGDPAAISRHREAIREHKPELLRLLTGKASGSDPEPPTPPDPLNPTGDPELARLLALPALDRMRELMWAGYRMEYEGGRLVRVIPPGQWAPIEAEPEGPHGDQHQGTAESVHGHHQGDEGAGGVACGDCRHFQRDRIGDPMTGIGRCSMLDNPPGGLLYPRITRRCSRFEAITTGTSEGGKP